MLLVDTGDMLPAVFDRQGELKGEVLARAYALMRYDAITLGETDLFFGPAYLNRLMADYGLPLISTNIAAAADSDAASSGEAEGSSTPQQSKSKRRFAEAPEAAHGESPNHETLGIPQTAGGYTARLGGMKPYVIKEVGGVRIALVGVLNHRVLMPKSVTDSITISPMEESLGEILPEIKSKSDLIVALAHVGAINRARALADSFPDLDVIVAGHVEVMPPYYEERGSTILAYTRNRGRFMGRLNLLLDQKKKIIGFGHDMSPMAPTIENDPDVLKLLAEYIDRLKILVASTAFRPTLKDLRVPPAHYVTAGACRECHRAQYAQWERTPHAHAFDTIEGKKRDFDPDCQRCHTTGFRYRSGFITPHGTPQFRHVQCEACHGPGGDHVTDPTGDEAERSDEESGTGAAPSDDAGTKPARYGAINERTCRRCHTPNNSPEFDYEAYLKRVVH